MSTDPITEVRTVDDGAHWTCSTCGRPVVVGPMPEPRYRLVGYDDKGQPLYEVEQRPPLRHADA